MTLEYVGAVESHSESLDSENAIRYNFCIKINVFEGNTNQKQLASLIFLILNRCFGPFGILTYYQSKLVLLGSQGSVAKWKGVGLENRRSGVQPPVGPSVGF